MSRLVEGRALTGTTDGAIHYGLQKTAGIITGAAFIMAAVFLAFAVSPVMNTRQFGVGTTVAVLLDATVVRLVLLPALIKLLGERTWWVPRWLERRRPAGRRARPVGVSRHRPLTRTTCQRPARAIVRPASRAQRRPGAGEPGRRAEQHGRRMPAVAPAASTTTSPSRGRAAGRAPTRARSGAYGLTTGRPIRRTAPAPPAAPTASPQLAAPGPPAAARGAAGGSRCARVRTRTPPGRRRAPRARSRAADA